MISMLAQQRFIFWLLFPTGLIIALVVLYPFLYNLWLSFTNMNMYHVHDARLVGFENYAHLFAESELYTTLLRTVIWTVVNVFFHVVFGVALAMLLNQPLKGRPIFRALLILPWAVPQYIVALTWRGMFNFQYGQINLILQDWFHLPPVPWLSNETWAFIAPTITNIWLGFPFMMVIALGGLQSIPKELYEAAAIDGASAWRRFRHVTLPLLKPVMVPAISLGIVWTFNNLNVIWLVTRGGQPADKTHILVTYVYKAAFTYYRYAYAAGFSVVIFLILLLFVIWFMRINRAAEGVAQ